MIFDTHLSLSAIRYPYECTRTISMKATHFYWKNLRQWTLEANKKQVLQIVFLWKYELIMSKL